MFRRTGAAVPNGSVVRLHALLLVLFFRDAFGAISLTALSFEPTTGAGTECYNTEIQIEFQSSADIVKGEKVYVALPGFTTSSCDNKKGNDLGSGKIMLQDDEYWYAQYTEGTVENAFSESQLILYAYKTVQGGWKQTVVIDSSNGFRPNQKITANDASFTIHTNAAAGPTSATAIATVQAISGGSYLTSSALDFNPPNPGERTQITFSFVPSMKVADGDTVTVKLPGFTRGNADGTPGGSLTLGNVNVVTPSTYWQAKWDEGAYVQHYAGFEASVLTLAKQGGTTYNPGTSISITLNVDNDLKAQCGMPKNNVNWTYAVTGAFGNVAETSIATSEAIGDGCKSLNYCSGNGECNHCLNECDCRKGWGAANETGTMVDINRDCSQRTCARGRAWGDLPTGTDTAHEVIECSNMGICDRGSGVCGCFDGYEGPACERQMCPLGGGVICSGRGLCYNTRILSSMTDALPLSNTTSSPDQGHTYYGKESTKTWDAQMGHSCHCDSVWSVGLGSGQTQERQYFGPACEFRHCPSGDDPETTVDETDCYGKWAEGKRGVGGVGNLCHVDCANRGTCDYSAGICTCFPGYEGHNCGTKTSFYGDGFASGA